MKKKYLIIGIFLVLGFLIFNKTLSELKPVPKVTFKSQNLDYDKKEPGSFKVENSAKWIGDGKAKITLEVKSVIKESIKSKDIVFVLDVSGSMDGDKIAKVKKDVKEMARAVLSNPKNRVALISFESGAKKLSNFTSDIDEFIKMVDRLKASGRTNYKAGLEEVDKILEGYKKENDKDIKTLFLTDGYPCVDTPNEVAVYKKLKQKYPYMDINAIQYEMGEDIKEEIKVISDNQYHADMINLNNILFEVGSALTYDNFVIKDFLSKNLKGDASTIKVNQGTVKLDGDQLIWNLGSYKTGKEAKLEIEVALTGSKKEFYKVNIDFEIKTSLENKKDDQLSSKTPILKGFYKVIYEANTPNGCTVKGLEKNTSHRPFEKVSLVKEGATCDGYLFQGYKLITDAKYINQDYIEMPESDVIFRATWTKAKVDKGMYGKIAEEYNLYNVMKNESLGNDKEKGIDYSKTNSSTNGEGVYLLDETKNDIHPVYFFRGTHNLNNNLLYANFCWKIVRTTETGGVRVVYNGTPVNGKCTNTKGYNTQIGTSAFNLRLNKKQYVGYIYGDDTNPYQNNNDSNIKKYIDNWYKTNIKDKSYESSLDKKSIYCGDRTEGIDKGGNFNYEVTERLKASKPTLMCPTNDSYSVELENRKLTYPISLLSADEVNLSGAGWDKINYDNNYLNTNQYYWLLSPNSFDNNHIHGYMIHVGELGQLIMSSLTIEFGVRPALTIAPSAPLLSGDGSQNNPYVI